jgi:hypothetical protein
LSDFLPRLKFDLYLHEVGSPSLGLSTFGLSPSGKRSFRGRYSLPLIFKGLSPMVAPQGTVVMPWPPGVAWAAVPDASLAAKGDVAAKGDGGRQRGRAELLRSTGQSGITLATPGTRGLGSYGSSKIPSCNRK